jgi:hypothetical protein
MALLLLCEHAQVNVPDVVRLGGGGLVYYLLSARLYHLHFQPVVVPYQ